MAQAWSARSIGAVGDTSMFVLLVLTVGGASGLRTCTAKGPYGSNRILLGLLRPSITHTMLLHYAWIPMASYSSRRGTMLGGNVEFKYNGVVGYSRMMVLIGMEE